MKLRAITVGNVRRFSATARVDGIGEGLNVLCQPNEYGKSTLFDAIQALFFKAHGARDKEIRSLQPHAGGAPEVTIELETSEGIFTVAKRWLSKPRATVFQGERLIAQADAAEDWIARLLGGGEGGPSGILWVRQGMTGLSGATPREEKVTLAARRDLMSSVGHEVEAMTGGRRMDRALERCRAELADYATGTGRPRTGGPWKIAQDKVAALETERATLSDTAAALRDALEARRRHRRELAELEDPETSAARAARLADATDAHAAALRHAEDVAAGARKVEALRVAFARAGERLSLLRETLAEQKAAASDAANLATLSAARRDEAAAARAAMDAAQAALDEATAAQGQAEEAWREAQRRQAARDGAARRAELLARLAAAEAARARMESAAAEARSGPDAAMLRRLEDLSAELATARAARDATVPRVVLHYLAGRDGTVRLKGEPLAERKPVAIDRAMRLEIEGIGHLDLDPGALKGGADPVEPLRKALREALDRAGCADLAEAREKADARAEAARRQGEAKAVLESLAPKGLDTLRAECAAIPVFKDEGEGPAPREAEAALKRAQDHRVAAQSARDAASERFSEAQLSAARAETQAAGASERVQRAEAALARLGDVQEAALAAELAEARSALDAAEMQQAEIVRQAPDLAGAEAALARARSVEEAARSAIARLKPELARLDERISRGAGDAVEERLAELDQALDMARGDLQRIETEVAVLRRLEAALDAAKTEARERYFAPVAAELKPLLRLLWPDADLKWEQETLLPSALVRNGAEEPIDILSGGTQEQVALLVRLAFARMLARAGRHAPVILDDALVFTDDDRIERMFDALHRQEGNLQILVLSCRQRAFRDLGGRALSLREVAVDDVGA